jgi:hypothetical protein
MRTTGVAREPADGSRQEPMEPQEYPVGNEVSMTPQLPHSSCVGTRVGRCCRVAWRGAPHQCSSMTLALMLSSTPAMTAANTSSSATF